MERRYHDVEWGREVHGDREIFERLSLEAFQSGLSWAIILRKREGFRSAFAGFHVESIAEFDENTVEELLLNAEIVRNRSKINATINNARVVCDMTDSLSDLVWGFQPTVPHTPAAAADIASVTEESAQLARELKRRGFRFVGPTTAYAMMQATGIVNDHLVDCVARHQAYGGPGSHS